MPTKKRYIFLILAIILCLTVFAGGVTSGSICPRKSALCRTFTPGVASKPLCTKIAIVVVHSAIDHGVRYHRVILSSIFHPPKQFS